MVTWTQIDLQDVTRFQSELHKVTISPESKVDLIIWLSLLHRKHGNICPLFSFQTNNVSLAMSIPREETF